MALKTKPRWDKYDGYMGNFRSFLAADIDLETEANVVLAVGGTSTGIGIGAGTTGVKGLMIVSVGTSISGTLLDGGINNQAGDPCDVGKHGEIVNFQPSVLTNTFAVTVIASSGNFTLKLGNPLGVKKATPAIAFNAIASAVDTGVSNTDDGLDTSGVTVTGTAPTFSVTLPDGWTLETNDAGATATVAVATLVPVAFTNYYGHADGSVNAVKGGDGIYVGHTAEKDRLIVNVLDATP